MANVNRSGRPDGKANEVDVHVGLRMAARRKLLRISQETLGKEMGVTFQQIQKYEIGGNRVSASRLYQAAKALKVEVGYFFEGLASTVSEADVSADPMNDPTAIRVMTRFNRLLPRQQKVLEDMMVAIHARE